MIDFVYIGLPLILTLGLGAFFFRTNPAKSKPKTDENKKEEKIRIGEYEYDITNFNHPGGKVIHFMTQGQDATNAFEELHYRSKKAKVILQSLPKRVILPSLPKEVILPSLPKEVILPSLPKGVILPSLPKRLILQSTDEKEMLLDFTRFRNSLEERGFFKPSYTHIISRLLELGVIYSAAIYLIPRNIYLSIILFGFFGGKCGWIQHEGGHHSLTGIIRVDKIIQNVFIGFGLFTDGNMWNHMHNRHHSTPQKVGQDMDLDTAPLVAFYKGAMEKYSRNSIVKWWLQFQMVTFLPITSGIFVMFFWIFYLHPRKIIRDQNVFQACIVALGHSSRILLFMMLGKTDIYHALIYHFLSLWISGVFLFGHFSLSHSFTPIVEKEENPNWVRYVIEHTVDIVPENPFVCWLMGFLNCQVIHHLFPSMPQFRGPEVSKS